MVHIAIAGGSSEVGREIIDALVATRKHDIVVMSRKGSHSPVDESSGLRWLAVDYNDKTNLVQKFRGIHTVLSFINVAEVQKKLIDASIAAGVKRFAPSEFGSRSLEGLTWYADKGVIREYLKTINKNSKVLEYTLFQPGLFMDYLCFPHRNTKHLTPLTNTFNFQTCQAVVIRDVDALITFTTVRDLVTVVLQAVDYKDEWPEVGGINGNTILVSELLRIGVAVRGRPFTVEELRLAEIETGKAEVNFALEAADPVYLQGRIPGRTDDQLAAASKVVLSGLLISSAVGAWRVSSEWNQLLPHLEFTQVEPFLQEVWRDKP